jgi:hypothetical protein
VRSGVVLLVADLSVDPWLDAACGKDEMDTVGAITTKVTGAVTTLQVGQGAVVDAYEDEVIGG